MAEINGPEKAIIIVGASNDRSKFANRAVRAYRDLGWTVYPVHPREKEVEGIPCSATVADVPGRAATLNLYLPPAVGLTVLDAAPAKGVKSVYVNPGAGSPELIERIRELGMNPIEACSIVAIGRRPQDYPG
jgi:predicted CoA-binding protein